MNRLKSALDMLGLRSRHLTNILGEPILGSARWHVLHSWEEMNNVRNEEDALIVRKRGIGWALLLLLEKLKKLKDLEELEKNRPDKTLPEGAKTLKKEADQILFIIVYKSFLADKNAPNHIKAFRREIMANFQLVGEFASNNLYSNPKINMFDYSEPFYNLYNKIRNVEKFIVNRPWLERGYNSAIDKASMKIAFSNRKRNGKFGTGIPGAPGASHLTTKFAEFLGHPDIQPEDLEQMELHKLRHLAKKLRVHSALSGEEEFARYDDDVAEANDNALYRKVEEQRIKREEQNNINRIHRAAIQGQAASDNPGGGGRKRRRKRKTKRKTKRRKKRKSKKRRTKKRRKRRRK